MDGSFESPDWMIHRPRASEGATGLPSLRPYVMIHPYNEVDNPGSLHRFSWFDGLDPLEINPLSVGNIEFANEVIRLDSKVYDDALVTPRWVFYDCAVMPGIICGFAARTEDLPPAVTKALGNNPALEWTPVSLFIVIPTLHANHWMAHNLGSANSLLPKELRWPGLGFLTKAFGLWYANIECQFGVTQWDNPAIKLHSNFGYMELVTSYTPFHTHAHSLTYRTQVDTGVWRRFFDDQYRDARFHRDFVPSGLQVEPSKLVSIQGLQKRLEMGEGPFFLDGEQVLDNDLSSAKTLFRPKG
jgi:hypothetical protein